MPTGETTILSSSGYSTPRLQILGREKKLFINLFSMVPMQKPQTLISLPLGYLSRHILIKWHNSGHWCGENYVVYFNKVFWSMLLQLPEISLAAHDTLDVCCNECDSACCLQTYIKHRQKGGDCHRCSPSKHMQMSTLPQNYTENPKRSCILFFFCGKPPEASTSQFFVQV